MRRWDGTDVVSAGVLIVAIVFVIGCIIGTSRADESRGEWFKGLKQPDTGISCCDLTDCRITNSVEWRADGWWADVNGVMTRIPPHKILRETAPLPDGAVICHGETGVIFCFVPPLMGA